MASDAPPPPLAALEGRSWLDLEPMVTRSATRNGANGAHDDAQADESAVMKLQREGLP